MKPSAQFWVGAACLVAASVMLRLYSHGEVIPLRQSFADFPLQISDRWRGQELGMDKTIVDVLKVDDYMMRVYQGKEPAPVWLYVGYYKSQRTGVSYHSPLNCLPGGGWTIMSRDIVPITFGDRTVHVNKVLIKKGLESQIIIYWYQDRGRVIASEYWAKGYMVWDAATQDRTDGSLVRVSVPVGDSSDKAFAQGVDFVREVFPLLSRYLPT
jgi:EpsI family protein